MTTCFILVRPQMGENIGFAARAMANFGISDLRLVAPRDGWPNPAVEASSAGAIQDGVVQIAVFPDVASAIADCHYVYATTARERAQAKLVVGPREAAQASFQRIQRGLNTAVLFGPERAGLDTDDVALANAVVTFPVNPEFSSLNLGQAVLLMAYELYQAQDEEGELLPFVTSLGSPPAPSTMVQHFIGELQQKLADKDYFTPPEREPTMRQNITNMIGRMELTEQDVKTLFAILRALSS